MTSPAFPLPRSRSWLRLVMIMIVGLTLLLGSTAVARADDSDDDSIDRMAVDATLQPDGSLEVMLDFDFNFGDDSGHGPYLTVPERMEIPDDSEHWRSLPVSEITASSDTAPALVETERERGAVLIRIGDEDVDLEGVHRYQVGYTIAGVLNPNAPGSGLDELNWNAIGTGWEIPLREVTVTTRTPVAIDGHACWIGEDYDQPCAFSPGPDDRSATYGPIAELEPGEGMQVVAAMPAGSFPGVQPILTERYTFGRVIGLNPVSAGLAALVAAAGAAIAVALRRREADLAFTDLTPGQRPQDPGTAWTTPYRKGPIAVQFTPPSDVRPAELDVLASKQTRQTAVSATLVDLAARGHLLIEQVNTESKQDSAGWLLRATDKQPAGLRGYERVLLDSLFADGPTVDLSTAGGLQKPSERTLAKLFDEVASSGWFRSDPRRSRAVWGLSATGLIVLGVALIFALGFTLGIGLVGVAVLALGVVVAVLASGVPGRSATGTALNVQAAGFRTYLRTAEADQIRFEEGVDIFSRYLPYAMIWGLTDRWTRVFAELAQRDDVDLVVPAWYVGASPWIFDPDGAASFAASLDGFSTAATSAMTAPSSGSGGGSGFSGGGGVGGGGGGGW